MQRWRRMRKRSPIRRRRSNRAVEAADDAADLDWIGDGDHDYGSGREYSWWTTQKAVTLFTIPEHFVPMYCYERSVSYPEGHRNCMFAQRGIRSLPRLPI